jgi:hypothetical protein
MESKHIEALFREKLPVQIEHPCEIGSDRADQLGFAYEPLAPRFMNYVN